jgi:hypothetical protein
MRGGYKVSARVDVGNTSLNDLGGLFSKDRSRLGVGLKWGSEGSSADDTERGKRVVLTDTGATFVSDPTYFQLCREITLCVNGLKKSVTGRFCKIFQYLVIILACLCSVNCQLGYTMSYALQRLYVAQFREGILDGFQ